MNILLPLHYKGYLNKISKAMQTTAIRTVAYLLPKNEVNLLTLLISKGYIPYTNLRKFFALKNSFFQKKSILLPQHFYTT